MKNAINITLMKMHVYDVLFFSSLYLVRDLKKKIILLIVGLLDLEFEIGIVSSDVCVKPCILVLC